VRCNHALKFGILPARARSLGLEAEFFATGHYARVARSPEYGVRLLLRAADRRRDQSYFLCRLTPEQVESALFPLGELAKEEVRELAKKAGLPVHGEPDSQDFYSGQYQDLLGAPPLAGAIVDEAGKELGRHGGYWNFTPGQRRGLGIAASEPLYVLRVDPVRNRVVVGPKTALLRDSCLLADPRFFVPLRRITSALSARLRSSQEPIAVTTREEGGMLRLFFASPQPVPAPGQSAVLYENDTLVGSGIIR
jgi:tRNA-specific 2-thiouridylase